MQSVASSGTPRDTTLPTRSTNTIRSSSDGRSAERSTSLAKYFAAVTLDGRIYVLGGDVPVYGDIVADSVGCDRARRRPLMA
jgi:hypothetical protein